MSHKRTVPMDPRTELDNKRPKMFHAVESTNNAVNHSSSSSQSLNGIQLLSIRTQNIVGNACTAANVIDHRASQSHTENITSLNSPSQSSKPHDWSTMITTAVRLESNRISCIDQKGLTQSTKNTQGDEENISNIVNQLSEVHETSHDKPQPASSNIHTSHEDNPSNDDNDDIQVQPSTSQDNNDNNDDNANNQAEYNKATNKNLYNKLPFVLPPEYNPDDTRWTLKHQSAISGVIEIMPHSHVYIEPARFAVCKKLARHCITLAGMLLTEIFSQNALSVCSLSKSKHYINGLDITRPNLDKHALIILLTFVQEFGIRNRWSVFDNKSVLYSIHRKMKEMRFKHGKIIRKLNTRNT